MSDRPTNDLPRLDDDLTLEERLGSGSGGSVWAARQVSLDRPVAVKRLHALAGSEARLRFAREATLMARVAHPGIVPVLLHGTLDGDPILVLERVDGSDLGRVIAALSERAGSPSRAAVSSILHGAPDIGTDSKEPWWRSATGLIIDVARALEHAHRSGVLHRDIKPANILMNRRMEPRLADFGGAALDGEFAAASSSGSLGYTAPELTSGGHATRASDVYALGVTLFELLTLQRPFEARSAAALTHSALNREIPRVRRGVPRDLEVVVRTALARDHTLRYASAMTFARDLEAVMSGDPIVARPESRLRSLGRTLQRHRGPVAVAAVFTLFVVGALAAVQWQRVRSAEAVRAAGLASERHLDISLGILENTVGRTAHVGMQKHPLMARKRADLIRLAIDATRGIEGGDSGSAGAFAERVRAVRLELRFKLHDIQRALGRYEEAAQGLAEARQLIPGVPLENRALAYQRLAYHTYVHAYTSGRQAEAVSLGVAALELTGGAESQGHWWSLRPGIWSTLTEAAIAARDLDLALARAEAGVLESRAALIEQPSEQAPRARLELARILTSLGAVHIERGSLELAERSCGEGLGLLAGCGAFPEVAGMRALAWNNMSLIARRRGDYAGGLVWLRKALATQDAAVEASPDSLYLRFVAARTRQDIARALGVLGRFGEELSGTLNRCVASTRTLCAVSPDSWQYHFLLARALELSVEAAIKRSDLPAARAAIKEALAAGAKCEALVPGSHSMGELDRRLMRRSVQLTLGHAPHAQGHSILTDYVERYGDQPNNMRIAASLMCFLAGRARGDRTMAVGARDEVIKIRRELALGYLARAVDLGYRDRSSATARRRGLEELQSMPGFEDLLERMSAP